MKRLAIIALALSLAAVAPEALAQKYVAAPVTVSKEKVKLNGKVYLSHVVLQNQTLFGISNAYGVSVDEIYEANPSLREKGLKKNSIILIPVKENAPAEPVTAEAEPSPQQQQPLDGSYTKHIVKWYEDIEGIANNYGVEVKDIMEANSLKSKKLSSRQELLIPLGKQASEPVRDEQEAAPEVQQAPEQPVPAQPQETVPELKPSSKDTVKISLVLPFHVSIGASELNMDFYSGVLMAAKQLGQDGIKVVLDTYDLMAGFPPTEKLIASDFVLGPVASRDIEAMLQRLEGKVPLISPLDQKAGTLSASYSNFIQAPTPAARQYEDLARWVKQDCHPADTVILVTEKGAASSSASVGVRSALAREDMAYGILNYAIPEGREIPLTMEEMFSKDGTNLVLVASESEAFIDDVVRNLGIMMGKGYKVVMYAPSKVRGFETIDGSELHGVSLHISSSYYVDYAKADQFVKAYRALFRTEPSQFALQGYDTVMHFAGRCAAFGDAWQESLSYEKGCGLHTSFLFERDAAGNLCNTAVRRIVYNRDYTTSIVY